MAQRQAFETHQSLISFFFADYRLPLERANRRECQAIVSIIDKYEKASGQKIHFQKSEVLLCPKGPYLEKAARMEGKITIKGGKGDLDKGGGSSGNPHIDYGDLLVACYTHSVHIFHLCKILASEASKASQVN